MHCACQDPRVVIIISRGRNVVTVLGEPGVGKTLALKQAYEQSGRGGKFIHIDIGAASQSLIESILFGYERGAFTGAQKAKPSPFEEAGEGVVFIDEIGNAPLEVQIKLLRVLNERTIQRVGSSRNIPIHCAIVCATNADLEAMVAAGQFRADLYSRISGLVVEIPPLRERGEEEIVRLAAGFLGREVDAATREVLVNYDWPGNVRELKNACEVAADLVEADPETYSLAEEIRRRTRPRLEKGGAITPGKRRRRAFEAWRQEAARLTREKGWWSAGDLAAAVGAPRRTVRRWLLAPGIESQGECRWRRYRMRSIGHSESIGQNEWPIEIAENKGGMPPIGHSESIGHSEVADRNKPRRAS